MDPDRNDPTSAPGGHRLVLFPGAGGSPDVRVAARARLAGHDLEVEFRIDGPIGELVLPPPGTRRERRDQLWRSTCFEVFVGVAGRLSYTEFNLAPSGDWAAWTFPSYRESPIPVGDVAPSLFQVERTPTSYRLAATLVLPRATRPDASGPAPSAAPSTADQHANAPTVLELNLTTVLETTGGTLTYFALAHTRQQPDFHAPEARVLRLAAVATALTEIAAPASARPSCNPGPGSGRSPP